MSDERWELPSPGSILEAIEDWRSLDLVSATDQDVESRVIRFMDRIEQTVVARTDKRFPALWRLQRDDDRDWGHTSALLYPPSHQAKPGRCNRQGCPVLYCADRASTTFDELRVQTGDRVVLIQYECTATLTLARLVGKFAPTHLDGSPLFEGEHLAAYQILRDFLRSEFMRPVGEGTEFLYRISAALCRHWLDSEESDGWEYPSLWSGGGTNVAIKSASVDTKLKIIGASRGVVKSMDVADFGNQPVNGIQVEITQRAKIDDSNVTWHPSDTLQFIRTAQPPLSINRSS